jgi:hypothetical protein
VYELRLGGSADSALCALRENTRLGNLCGFAAAIAPGSWCVFEAALSDFVRGIDQGWEADPGHALRDGR